MTHKVQLLLPADYVRDATAHIKKAKTRISFLSMLVTDDEATDELIDALCSAAKRGVEVNIAADVFTYGELNGSFIPIRYFSKKLRPTTRMVKDLTDSGATFHWLGRLTTTMFNGRTHIKCCVVDDTIYSFGGVNLYEKGIANNDYMFRLTDGKLADKLVEEYARLVAADSNQYSYRSHSFSHDHHEVLIDGGFFGDSIIYRRACELVAEASRVIFVSQYCPTGKLSKLLKRTDSRLYFNPWQRASDHNRWVIRIGMFLSKHKTLYTRDQYLHAKFMLFDMPDGRRVALTGSHNFVHGGVLLGTREIALETSDPSVIQQLTEFWENNVA